MRLEKRKTLIKNRHLIDKIQLFWCIGETNNDTNLEVCMRECVWSRLVLADTGLLELPEHFRIVNMTNLSSQLLCPSAETRAMKFLRDSQHLKHQNTDLVSSQADKHMRGTCVPPPANLHRHERNTLGSVFKKMCFNLNSVCIQDILRFRVKWFNFPEGSIKGLRTLGSIMATWVMSVQSLGAAVTLNIKNQSHQKSTLHNQTLF